MSDTKLFAVFLIILAGFGVYLHSQNKLIPVMNAIVQPTQDKSQKTVSIGAFLVAFVTYLFILSFLNTRDGVILTVVVVTGGLLYNQKTMGTDSVLSVLLSKTQGQVTK
jgi:hypothetical protein